MSVNLSESKQAFSSLYFVYQENNILCNGTNFSDVQLESLQRGRQYFGSRDSFKLTLDYVNLYCTPVILFTGIMGNLALILVLLKTFLKVKPWSLFLAFQAFVDTGYLLCLFLIWLPRIKVPNIILPVGNREVLYKKRNYYFHIYKNVNGFGFLQFCHLDESSNEDW